MLTVEDRLDIAEVLARYTQALDYGAIDQMPELWTSDCRFRADNPEVDLSGIDELITFFRRTAASVPNVRHVISNNFIEPESPEKALQHAYLQIVDFKQNRLIAAGRYRDVMVKTDRGWRIKEREFKAG